MEHIPIFLAVFIPGISFAVAWGGAAYALKSHSVLMTELKLAIAELRCELRTIVEKHNKEMNDVVRLSDCRDDRSTCALNRESFRNGLSKQIDDLASNIKNQDEKRHAQNNHNMKYWGEIAERIAAVETILKERKT